MRISRSLVFAAIFSLAGLAGGQVNAGTPSFSAYDSHQYDTVNLQNLNVVLNIPIMSKSGAFPFRAGFTGGDSYVYATGGNMYPGIVAVPLVGTVSGILGYIGSFAAPSVTQYSVACPGGGYTTKYSNWYIQFADGSTHWLPASDYTDQAGCLKASFTDRVIDGTGYTLSVTGSTVNSIYDRSGTTLSYSSNPNTLTDSNGNTIKWNYSNSTFTDTLGLTALTGGGSSFSWTDVSGGSPQVTMPINYPLIQSAFNCSGKNDYYVTAQQTSLPLSVNFPDGSSIGLAYEPTPGVPANTTGRVSEITLRGGGTIAYNYNPSSGANDGLNCTYVVPNKMTRTTSDGTTTYTWAVVNNGSGHYGNTTTVVDNGGNTTVYTFTGLTSTGNAAPPVTQALTQVQHYQDASTLLTTDVYCYNGATTGCATAVVSLPITEVDVYHTISGMSNSSRQQTQYDGGPSGSLPHYGNVTYSAQYDFGATTPTQATTIVYGSSNGSGTCSAIGNNINDKPCTIITTQNGATVGYKQFTYNANGNLLKSYVSPNGGASFLSNATNNSYNSNGAPSVTYDLANNSTTYSYSINGYLSCSGCTNYPFPTSITKGGLTTSSTWHGIGGVKLTDTDASGNVTTYGYTDPWNRVTSIQDPLGNTVYKSYSPTSLGSSFAFGSSVNNTTTTFDGYGRTINVQTKQGPSATSYDTVSTSYTWGGTNNDKRLISTNVPCTANLNATCGITHSVFTDVLGRTTWTSNPVNNEYVSSVYTQNDVLSTLGPAPSGENTKQVQKQFDGLGRLTSVCKISSAVGGNALCKQNTNTTLNGIVTTTSYTSSTGSQTVSSTRGSQTRSQTVDGLGRVTSTVTPEGRTTNYSYDVAGCYNINYPGHLTAGNVSNGNSYCYAYDSLGRMTLAYGLAPNGSTLCRKLFYDNSTGATGTIPSGITITNPYGRVVEAETDNCNSPVTPITDEWFSYDKDGHVTDMWELTPHSGTYYHSIAQFAGNGTITSLQLANPSLYTLTYGLDGEGRWNTLKEGTTQSIVTGPAAMYNASGQATEIDLLGSDKDLFTYDSSTGRMKTWEFQVNSVNETGTLTWNANGTLGQMAITDGFNAAGSQTCNYNPNAASGTGYDDLGRLVGVDCGSGGWGQTFSYDQYDNLTKAVISGRTGITWNPGYDQTTNRYQLGGTSYDGSGNLLKDTFNTYTWDQFNKLQSVNSAACGSSGECVTYDAFGRMVEKSSNAAYTQVWYTQLGKTAYMKGSTINYAYVPTPGGGTAYVSGNIGGIYYMHKDWLGNARISSTINNHTVVADQAFAPYGEGYDQVVTQTPLQMFTGDTQDIVASGHCCFDTPNRELSANQGRWLSPDPAGAGWNQYAYSTNPNSRIDPTGLDDCFCDFFFGSDEGGGDIGGGGSGGGDISGAGSTSGVDLSPVTPDSGLTQTNGGGNLCSCLGDVTSGVLNVMGGPPPSLGPQTTSSGTPSGIQIVGLAFQYQGPNCCYTDSSGNPAPLFPSQDRGATIFANAWILQVANENGQPMSGNFTVTETVNTVSGNVNPYLVNYNYTWNNVSFNGQFVDNIVLAPNNLNYNLGMQNTQTFRINGTPASTVINQFAFYQAGMGLVIGNPAYANGP